MPLMTKMNNEARKELAMTNNPVRQSAVKAGSLDRINRIDRIMDEICYRVIGAAALSAMRFEPSSAPSWPSGGTLRPSAT